ncbi:MAG: nucleoside deaminase [Clostridia bacterium]|nr:nucleoside deaminase [Clostridia bacterium]
MDRYDFMNEAIKLAEDASNAGEIPVGCVIVKDGKIIAEGKNRTEETKSSIMHAEVVAIENACKALSSPNLSGCEMYVTLEPCPMCAGAIINSKISKVVFGTFDLNYGACGSALNLFSIPKVHRPECYGGISEDRCSDLLSEFFKNIRTNKNGEC